MTNQTCKYNCKNGRIFNTVLKMWQSCPDCASALAELTSAVPSEKQIDLFERLKIDPELRGSSYDPNTFFEPMTFQIFAQQSLRPVIEQLSAIETAIMSSQILMESSYFYTGLYSRITEYVCHCLMEAVRHGLTAVPYVSLKELQGIRMNTKQTAKLFSEITWYDYISADICFVAATANADNDEAILLAELLQDRARKGLPTYVTGYWTASALSKNRNSMAYLIDASCPRLALLHPFEIITLARFDNTLASMGTLGVAEPQRTYRYRESAHELGVSLDKYKEV